MIRTIIQIDEEKCNGCGICADACHEGAIEIIGGKAKLVRDDFCDGFGDCLPACPTGASTFVEREAPAYNEAAVLAAKKAKEAPLPCGCPGSACHSVTPAVSEVPGQLRNFPVQIKLAPVQAPWYDGAHLLIAADCTAYAYGDFHRRFIQGKITLIGCPKLDSVDYSEKLAAIFSENNIQSVTVVRMQVPCCGGLPFAVKNAMAESGKDIPLQVVTVTADGRILG
jgi:NAD-dependent dihydropyrimidine dehydrogenase PreA subunit